MGELAQLPNIGPVVEQQLNKVGIRTYEELKKTGSRQAWLHIKAIDDSACLNRLYALEGAIQDVKKTLLPPDERAALKAFYDAHK